MKKIHRFGMVSIHCGLIIFLLSCGSARRSEPLKGALDTTEAAVQHGQKVFATHCQKCHPGGEGGLGPAINNKFLPGFMIKMQVRYGIGKMPSFSGEVISDKELDNLVEFIKVLKNNQ